MKKNLILGIILLTLISCGKNGPSGNGNSQHTNPITDSKLSREEEKVVNTLIEIQMMKQIELIKLITHLKSLDNKTLKRIELYVDVQCSQTSGMCFFTHKG